MGRNPTANVRCPHCNYAYSKQIQTAVTVDGYRRLRKCLDESCGRQFTTYEIVARLSTIRALRKFK